ncbi:MAG: glycoside hydrolase family 25 protein [Cypionkella sp.]|jgi:lysozyme|nr:glycoside hydrolase family 25 protein [Cypionkella sp.]
MKPILVLVMSLALAACGGGPSPEPRAGATLPGVVIAPNFGDRDPHPWQGRAPSSYPVHGTDTSRYQEEVDWVTARANGVNFTFIKATEGVDDADPKFREHWNSARAAGVATGAYHFWYHCAPGRAQAQNFIRRVPRSPGALPPVLDLEWTPFSPTCTRRTPQAELLAEAQAYIDTVARHYGQMPIVYVSPDIFEARELWRLRGVEFWLRSVAGHPSQVYPGTRWTFWQYSGTGRIPGKSGDADLNVFAGSAADWRDWLARRTQ